MIKLVKKLPITGCSCLKPPGPKQGFMQALMNTKVKI